MRTKIGMRHAVLEGEEICPGTVDAETGHSMGFMRK